jgi:hypothetical protein
MSTTEFGLVCFINGMQSLHEQVKKSES